MYGMLEAYVFTIESSLYFLSFLITFTVASFVCYQKCRDPVIMMFVASFYCMATFSISTAMMVSSTTIAAWRLWRSFYVLSDMFGVSFMVHFTRESRFGSTVSENKKVLALYVVPFLYFVVLFAFPHLFLDPVVEMEGSSYGRFNTAHRGTPLHILRSLYLIVMLVMLINNFFRMFQQGENPALRRRMAYFVLASLFPLISVLTTRFAYWIFDYSFSFNLATVLIPFPAIIMTYGIVKEQLFDINLVVKKSILYTIFTTILAGAFVGIEGLMERLVSTTLPILNTTILGGIEVAKAATSGMVLAISVPAKRVSDNLTDRMFPDIVESALARLTPEKVIDLYREELKVAWRDGELTDKEEEMLHVFRESMHISDALHEQLEREAREGLDGGDLTEAEIDRVEESP